MMSVLIVVIYLSSHWHILIDGREKQWVMQHRIQCVRQHL